MNARRLLLLVTLLACTGQIGDPNPLEPVEPIPDDPRAIGPRHARRLSAAQLRASLITTTGFDYEGEARVRDPNSPQGSVVVDDAPLLDVFSASLGAPDYNYVTQPDRGPNVTFAKLSGDGVRAVCRLVSDAEVGEDAPGHPSGEPHLALVPSAETSRSEEVVRANLAQLTLRYWGEPHDPSDATIDALLTLFDSVPHDLGLHAAWRTVCIGMLSDPRFLTY